MLACKYCFLFLSISVQRLTTTTATSRKHGLFHKKMHVGKVPTDKATKRFNFHSTQNVDDLVRNPNALNRDELREINKIDNMNDQFMNPQVTSETQALSRQGLDPDVAMQISKIDQNIGDILGPRRANQQINIGAKQKGEILPGYGEQYNPDGSVNLSNNEWPEYQIKDSPSLESKQHDMLLGNAGVSGLQATSPQVSPQATLNPNLLPGQKSDLGLGMGVGMDKSPLMAGFANDIANDKSMNKQLLNSPFEKPEIKNAGFRIPGEFSFKSERKPNEDANFVKNFMSSKKSHTSRTKTSKQ